MTKTWDMTSQARKELKWGKSCLKELSTQIIKLEKNNKKKEIGKDQGAGKHQGRQKMS